jgi:uncharacterized membrane protein
MIIFLNSLVAVIFVQQINMKPSLLTKRIFLTATLLAILTPSLSFAQELHDDYPGTWKAKVIEIIDERNEELFDTSYLIQTMEAEVLEGPQKGEIIKLENDFFELEKGDKFYFNHNIFFDEENTYAIVNIAREGPLLLLLGIFVLAVIAFGRWQGVRSLVALVASFIAIIFVLIPGILNGWNPLLASFLVAGAILFAAIFFTHGFNRESTVAYVGTMIAVVLAGLFAIFAVHITKLSGFAAEEAVYLNFNTGGTINFTALLLGAFIIGFLGVLDDIAITQSAVVTELYNSNPDISQREVYSRAMRVGREHVGALVNTLVLAYTGASLPLLLYFNLSPTDIGATINLEIFATEIVRIIVGSIGLILTVPIVTFLAVKYLKGYKPRHGHHHGHGH